MADNYFEATVRTQLGAATIDLNGEFTLLADEAFQRAYRETETSSADVLFLNFAGVNYINSAGIALLISLLAQVRQSGRSLMAYGLCPHYLELFKLAGLTEYMPVLPNEVLTPV